MYKRQVSPWISSARLAMGFIVPVTVVVLSAFSVAGMVYVASVLPDSVSMPFSGATELLFSVTESRFVSVTVTFCVV